MVDIESFLWTWLLFGVVLGLLNEGGHPGDFPNEVLHDWNGAGSGVRPQPRSWWKWSLWFERVLDQLGVSKNCREL